MILFTILSRAAYNFSLAEVRVDVPSNQVMSQKIVGQGQVEAKQEIAVVTEENHLIKTVYVTVGQTVEAGEVLYELDLVKLEEDIEKKQQEIQLADLQLQSAQSAVRASEQNRQLGQEQAQEEYNRAVEEGDAAVQQAESELIQAQSAYQEYQEQPDGHPEQTEAELADALSEKQAAYDAAITSRDDGIYAAQKAIDAANVEEVLDTSVEQYQIELQRLQEELEKIQALQNAKGKISSPIKGLVTEVAVKPGGRTSGGGDILLADASAGARLVAVFSEEAKEYLKRGEKVQLSSSQKTPAFSKISNEDEKTYELTIDAVTEGTEENPGLTATVNLPAELLDIGSTASIEIKTPSQSYHTCVPLSALNQEEKREYYVNVLEKTDSVLGEVWEVHRAKVELLDQDAKYAAVSGIAEGQEIVIESSKELEDGSRVKRKGL